MSAKKDSPSIHTKRNVMLAISGGLILLIIAWNIPLGTAEYNPQGSNGIVLPVGLKQGKVCCMYAVDFTSPRGIIGASIDMENALKNYHKIKATRGDNAKYEWYTNDNYSIIFRYNMVGFLFGTRIWIEYGYNIGDIGKYFEGDGTHFSDEQRKWINGYQPTGMSDLPPGFREWGTGPQCAWQMKYFPDIMDGWCWPFPYDEEKKANCDDFCRAIISETF